MGKEWKEKEKLTASQNEKPNNQEKIKVKRQETF
mgnify:CR=1 FL=1